METLESNDDWWQAVPMRNLQKWQELQGEIEIELQPTPQSDWFQTIFCAVQGGATQPDEMAALPTIRCRVPRWNETHSGKTRKGDPIIDHTRLVWCVKQALESGMCCEEHESLGFDTSKSSIDGLACRVDGSEVRCLATSAASMSGPMR